MLDSRPDDRPVPSATATRVAENEATFAARHMSQDQQDIIAECDAIKKLLLQKNAAYGSSWSQPLRIFSKADVDLQLRVRIDDKLSRLSRGSGVEDEDVVQDLLGYLVLLRIAQRRQREEEAMPE